MRITLAAIGRAKNGPELELYEHYRQRLPWKITLKELDTKPSLPAAQRMASEAELLLNACKDAEKLVALDERGSELSSEQFARQIKNWQDQSTSHIAFTIGGADGLAPAIREKSALTLALGKMTWPHMLVRGLLMEQLYRAHTILTNHPYHRS